MIYLWHFPFSIFNFHFLLIDLQKILKLFINLNKFHLYLYELYHYHLVSSLSNIFNNKIFYLILIKYLFSFYVLNIKIIYHHILFINLIRFIDLTRFINLIRFINHFHPINHFLIHIIISFKVDLILYLNLQNILDIFISNFSHLINIYSIINKYLNHNISRNHITYFKHH